ncbi:2-oxo acid dehydrogenase subunit E2 [Halegenticoccus soli]|uniref:2-oxo acid dehydrogenase subunit E2 n=1 Tax=Halegenticoccus soli TaxID=1985678 RepID=UPI000C6D595B|nr:2-oxo acid dehydrogenase subunit E2 [Halegenticoccus soli]
MGYIVRMPTPDSGADRGALVEWHVSEGDQIEEGEDLATVRFDEAADQVTISAPADGTMRRLYLTGGESVRPGAPVGLITGTDEAGGPEVDEEGDFELDASAGVEASPRARRRARELAVDLGAVDGTGPQGAITGTDVEATAVDRLEASPYIRRLARDHGIDLTTVEGTGPEGEITADDVIAAVDHETIEAAWKSSPYRGRTTLEERPMTESRQAVAGRLRRSYREVVHANQRCTVDAEALFAAVDAANDDSESEIEIKPVDAMLALVAAALTEHPELNATYTDHTHRLHVEHNLSVGVDTDDGLVAPVVYDVDSLSLEGIAEERRRATKKALSGGYTTNDLSGGTFTLVDLSDSAVESFEPIVNQPQVAALCVAGVQRSEATDRRRLPLVLSFDHRVITPADAAGFLGALADRVANPRPALEGAEPGR